MPYNKCEATEDCGNQEKMIRSQADKYPHQMVTAVSDCGEAVKLLKEGNSSLAAASVPGPSSWELVYAHYRVCTGCPGSLSSFWKLTKVESGIRKSQPPVELMTSFNNYPVRPPKSCSFASIQKVMNKQTHTNTTTKQSRWALPDWSMCYFLMRSVATANFEAAFPE